MYTGLIKLTYYFCVFLRAVEFLCLCHVLYLCYVLRSLPHPRPHEMLQLRQACLRPYLPFPTWATTSLSLSLSPSCTRYHHHLTTITISPSPFDSLLSLNAPPLSKTSNKLNTFLSQAALLSPSPSLIVSADELVYSAAFSHLLAY